MATTEKGIYYPTDYTKAADVPADMKKMAESVESILENIESNFDNIDSQVTQNKSNITQHSLAIFTLQQTTDNQSVEINQLKNEQDTQNTEMDKLQTRIQQLQANMINETTEEATILHVTDVADLPAKLSVRGNHKQEVTDNSPSMEYPSDIETVKEEVNVIVENKNMFNVPSSNNGGVELTLQEDGSYKLNGNSTTAWVYRYGSYIWLAKGKYTISADGIDGLASCIFGVRNDDGSFVKQITPASSTLTFEVLEDIKVRPYFTCSASAVYNNNIVKVQLEKSEAKTEWVKHEEESYVLDVQQEMLQGDYFIKEADGWKEVHLREKRLIKDSISNAYSSASKNSIYISQLLQDTAKIPANNNEDALMLSNFAIHATQAELASASIDYGIALSDTGSLCIRCKNLSTVDEYKTALNNDSYYYYYYLATPSKLACTEAQSKVLDQLSELELFKGTNNIITADNLALLQMTYTVDMKAYIDSKIGGES